MMIFILNNLMMLTILMVVLLNIMAYWFISDVWIAWIVASFFSPIIVFLCFGLIVFLNSISGLILIPLLYSLPFVFLILGLGSALLIWIIRY
ncbi:hypothetical protein [Legionella sp. km772]|uniref:hypothetical protein n=1 Tax=Legionella sp. km772 TaxID=2498111 RepID=UPI000F8F578E|nr:hypothetical protein [Legionella sp. km772]RUR11307.1 hypothetical protein ELY15_07240 [Legionella sp. km772]